MSEMSQHRSCSLDKAKRDCDDSGGLQLLAEPLKTTLDVAGILKNLW